MENIITIENAWTFTSAYGIQNASQPLILAGDRIIGCYQNKIFGIDIYKGQPFNSETDKSDSAVIYESQDSTDIFVGEGNGKLYFAENGKLQAISSFDASSHHKWTAPDVSGDIKSINVYGDTLTLIIDEWGETRYLCFNSDTGEALSDPISLSQYSPGKVAYGDEALFFVANQRLMAVNTYKGDIRFPQVSSDSATSFKLSQDVEPIVAKDHVIALGEKVYGFSIENGELIWSFDGGDPDAGIWQACLSEDANYIVALSPKGHVFKLDVTDGTTVWHSPAALNNAVVPTIAHNQVFITSQDKIIYSVDYKNGKPTDSYQLNNASITAPIIGNGTFFYQTNDGNIHALPYGTQDAAYFNGEFSRIQIPSESDTFDFKENFSIEAWVRTTQGGEIISSIPTVDSSKHNYFRLFLDSYGQLCYGAFSLDGKKQDLVKSYPSNAANGFWHHIAAVREDGKINLFVDGQFIRSSKVQYRDGKQLASEVYNQLSNSEPAPALPISGNSELTIGAHHEAMSASNPDQKDCFKGLIREVRLWSRALDITKIQNRMRQELRADTPALVGYWRMDKNFRHLGDNQSDLLKNAISGIDATFFNAYSTATDLHLDDSLFPYLIDSPVLQWPYHSEWNSRGEQSIQQTPHNPAFSENGVVAYATNNALYGVRAQDGHKQWSYEAPLGLSSPLGTDNGFFTLTGQESVVYLDGLSGKVHQVEGLKNLISNIPDSASHFSRPVIYDDYLGAVSPGGKLAITQLGNNGYVRNFDVGHNAQDLQTNQHGLLGCMSSLDSDNYQLDIVSMSSSNDFSPLKCNATRELFSMDGNWLSYIDGNKLLTCKLNEPGHNEPVIIAQSTEFDTSQITGLLLLENENLLVISTSEHEVYGLCLASLGQRWLQTLPKGKAETNTSFKGSFPAVYAQKTLYISDSSGTLALLDPINGDFRGLLHEHNSLVTAPSIQNGTVYFGTSDALPNTPLDGALNCVLIGEKATVRLGLDPEGHKINDQSYADIQSDDPYTGFKLMKLDQTCVEAWINAESGGEVLSVAPSQAGDFSLRFWLDATGIIHFKAHETQGDENWSGVYAHSRRPDNICDRRWHHIAVSCKSYTDIRIYIDGKPIDVDLSADQEKPDTIVKGRHAQIGRNVNCTKETEANYFSGLIGEVRLWDTYLVADEIAGRLHSQLRGNEPDLLAYWHFDASSIHDYTRHGHNGKLINGHYWLSDLVFEKPDYPYLTTAAKIIQAGEKDTQGDLGKTRYQLEVRSFKADGSPLGNQELELWYVIPRKTKSPLPDTINVSGNNLNAVTPDHEFPQTHSVKITTQPDGIATIIVETPDLTHGPSLDLRAEFMPSNERFHINVLIDNQSLDKPAPPRLEVQSKLLQDYHYKPGGKIDASRSKATYTSIIKAMNSDHSPRALESLELWADDPVKIEINGKHHNINLHNSLTTFANEQGELHLIIDANDLNPPNIRIRSGFMHRNDRLVFSPAKDTHSHIASLQEKDLTDEKEGIWNKDKTTKSSLLKDDYKKHAKEISGAFRHVMQGSVNKNNQKQTTVGGPGAQQENHRFKDMRQIPYQVSPDTITTLRCLTHIPRSEAITPEYMLSSLQSETPDALGFVLEGDGDASSLKIRHVTDASEMKLHMGTPTIHNNLQLNDGYVGGFFSHAWHGIKHGVSSAISKAKKIAIAVTHTVTVAVHYVDHVVHVAVNSIKDAIEIVGNFLKKLALELVKFIEFLLFLFDWKAIIETHSILRGILSKGGEHMIHAFEHELSETIDPIVKEVKGLIAKTPPPVTALPSAYDISQQHNNNQNNCVHFQSVAGKSFVHKSMHQSQKVKIEDTSSSTPTKPTESTKQPDDLLQSIINTGQEIESVLTSLPNMKPHEILDSFQKIISDIDDDVLIAFKDLTQSAAASIKESNKALQKQIHIPFISELYKWIVGSPLTLLDFICLTLAVPTNIGYSIATQPLTGKSRHFNDDAKSMAEIIDQQLVGGTKFPLNDAEYWSASLGFLALSEIGRWLSLLVDESENSLFNPGTDNLLEPLVDVIRSVAQMLSGMVHVGRYFIHRGLLVPDYIERMQMTLGSDLDENKTLYIERKHHTSRNLFYGYAAAEGISLISGAYNYSQIGKAVHKEYDKFWDNAGLVLALGVTGYSCYIMYLIISDAVNYPAELTNGNSSSQTAASSFLVHDIMDTCRPITSLFRSKAFIRLAGAPIASVTGVKTPFYTSALANTAYGVTIPFLYRLDQQ